MVRAGQIYYRRSKFLRELYGDYVLIHNVDYRNHDLKKRKTCPFVMGVRFNDLNNIPEYKPFTNSKHQYLEERFDRRRFKLFRS